MSVRTSEELIDRIDKDLIWRKKELTILKTALQSARQDRKPVLLRSLVTLLYAHWEGFIKNTSQSYLEYVSNRRLPYTDLTSNIVALSLQSRVKSAANQRHLGPLAEIVDLLRSGLDTRSTIPYKNAVDTEANLSFLALRNITTSLGIDFSPFETKSLLIDERLLNSRNRIAHGEHLVLDEDAGLELAMQIQAMIEQYRNIVENAAVSGDYRRSA